MDPLFEWRILGDQLIAGAAPQEGQKESNGPGLVTKLLPGPWHLGAGVQLHVRAHLAELGVVCVQEGVPCRFSCWKDVYMEMLLLEVVSEFLDKCSDFWTCVWPSKVHW